MSLYQFEASLLNLKNTRLSGRKPHAGSLLLRVISVPKGNPNLPVFSYEKQNKFLLRILLPKNTIIRKQTHITVLQTKIQFLITIRFDFKSLQTHTLY